MKTRLLFTLAILLNLNTAKSQQCSFTLAPVPGHVKVTTSQTLNATGTVYWICSGLTVNIASSAGSVYMLENNVTLNITGTSGDAVNAKSGCIINNSSSGAITVTSNTANVTRNNTGSGAIVDIVCASVVFDYSLLGASAGPCSGVNSIQEYQISEWQLYPNPVSRGNEIVISETNKKIDQISIMDLTGKMIYLNNDGSNKIPTSQIERGFYILEVKINGVKSRNRVLVQ